MCMIGSALEVTATALFVPVKYLEKKPLDKDEKFKANEVSPYRRMCEIVRKSTVSKFSLIFLANSTRIATAWQYRICIEDIDR